MPQPPNAPPPEARWEKILAPALVAAALLALLAPSCDPGLQYAARDAGRMLYPLKHFVADEWAAGRVPQWMPYLAMGEPLVSGVVAGVFDPLNLLGVALPFAWGYKAMYAACYALAALASFLWARRRGLGASAAAGAALAFVLSGYLVGCANNLVYLRGVALAPLFLWALEGALERGGAPRVALAALAWALLLVGGEPQSWLLSFVLGLGLAFAAPRAPEERRPMLVRGLAVGLLGALLCTPVLLPAALEYPNTDRAMFGSAGTVTQWWFAPARLPELFVPGLLSSPQAGANPVYAALFSAGRPEPWVPSQYLGCLALALAVLGALDRRGRGALIALALALWLAAGPALGASQAGARIPVWSSFQYPEKLMGWAALAASLLVGLGLDRLRGLKANPLRLALGAAVAAGIMGGLALGAHGLAQSVPAAAAGAFEANLRQGALHAALVLALAAAAAALLRNRRAILAVVLVGLIAGDLGLAHSVRAALLPSSVLDARGPFAEWMHRNDPLGRVSTPFEFAEGGPTSAEAQYALWSHTLVPLWNVEARVGNLGWYGALARGRYRLVREAGKEGFRYLEAAAAHGAGYVVVPGALENLQRIGLSAADVVASEPRVPASLVRVAHRPFAYLAGHAQASGAEEALAAVLTPGFAAGDRTMVETGAALPSCDGPGTAQASCPAPGRCSVRVSTPCATTLVVNLPAVAGWTFRVDGAEVPVLAANFLASAVEVPAGEHEVALAYSTPGLAEGWLVAGLGLALASLAAFRSRRRAGEPAADPVDP